MFPILKDDILGQNFLSKAAGYKDKIVSFCHDEKSPAIARSHHIPLQRPGSLCQLPIRLYTYVQLLHRSAALLEDSFRSSNPRVSLEPSKNMYIVPLLVTQLITPLRKVSIHSSYSKR